MKKIITITLTLLIFSCSSDVNTNSDNNTETAIVTEFLQDITTLKEVNSKSPIADFQEAAKTSASKILELDKNNIETVLTEAKTYKNCVIITGNHTIVKILDFDDCKQSSSWGYCMPIAEGYIKKGELVSQEDYINNIIGRPDAQKRTVYLFE
ncbi:MAG: hypothetical protein COB15_16020 [Flavobacteriales bacterium]|nr:MAG: hypothetical protein COB15_16020 [Flavobacteriales bacterium]